MRYPYKSFLRTPSTEEDTPDIVIQVFKYKSTVFVPQLESVELLDDALIVILFSCTVILTEEVW